MSNFSFQELINILIQGFYVASLTFNIYKNSTKPSLNRKLLVGRNQIREINQILRLSLFKVPDLRLSSYFFSLNNYNKLIGKSLSTTFSSLNLIEDFFKTNERKKTFFLRKFFFFFKLLQGVIYLVEDR